MRIGLIGLAAQDVAEDRSRATALAAIEVLLRTPQQARQVNSLLLTCGLYDAVGEFAYRVGLPAKSGVGGGIVCAMPRRFTVCVWSPGLGPSGNSHAGMMALEAFTTRTGISIF